MQQLKIELHETADGFQLVDLSSGSDSALPIIGNRDQIAAVIGEYIISQVEEEMFDKMSARADLKVSIKA